MWDKSSSKLSSNVSLVMSCVAGKLEEKNMVKIGETFAKVHQSFTKTLCNSSSENAWKWDAYVQGLGYLTIPYDQLEVSIALSNTWCFMKFMKPCTKLWRLSETCASLAWMDKRGQIKCKQTHKDRKPPIYCRYVCTPMKHRMYKLRKSNKNKQI